MCTHICRASFAPNFEIRYLTWTSRAQLLSTALPTSETQFQTMSPCKARSLVLKGLRVSEITRALSELLTICSILESRQPILRITKVPKLQRRNSATSLIFARRNTVATSKTKNQWSRNFKSSSRSKMTSSNNSTEDLKPTNQTQSKPNDNWKRQTKPWENSQHCISKTVNLISKPLLERQKNWRLC